MRITKKCLLTLLISATSAFGQDIRQDVEPDPNPRGQNEQNGNLNNCLLYTSPSPRDGLLSRMPSSA